MNRVLVPNCGEFALVDDEDYDRVVSVGVWRLRTRNGRRSDVRHTMPDNRPVTMHRFILGDVPGVVDHANGNVLDNRRANLRVCSVADNVRNRALSPGNTSGFKGVGRSGRPKAPWIAYLTVGSKTTNLGRYQTKEQAARAYDAAAVRHYGEFARTNVMLGLLPPLEV